MRAQTATEYLVLIAVVIIIALTVVGIMGGLPSLGGELSAETAQAVLAAQKLGVSDYAVSDYGTTLTLRNNQPEAIQIQSITLDGELCTGIGTPGLSAGQSKQVVCSNVYEFSSDTARFPVVINYTLLKTSATYSQNDDKAQLIGPVAPEYQRILDNHPTYNKTKNMCWNWTNAGTPSVHPICTCKDLANISYDANTLGAEYILLNNIDLVRCDPSYGTGLGWTPIGTCTGLCMYDGDDAPFLGTLDGNGYFINNLYINRPAANYLGLFSNIATPGMGATIRNLGLTGTRIIGSDIVGGIAAYAEYSTIDNVYMQGTVTGINNVGGLLGWAKHVSCSDSYVIGTVSGDIFTGGLIALSDYGTIDNGYMNGQVNGRIDTGGLTGYGYMVTITDSYFSGTIRSTGTETGGLCGFGESAQVDRSYVDGSINATTTLGGLIGFARWSRINNSYSTATIQGTSSVGGITGYGPEAIIDHSYVSGPVNGTTYVGGIGGWSYSIGVTNSHVTATVSGVDAVGGLFGYAAYSSIDNSYTTGTVNGTDTVGGLVGYAGHTTIDNSYTIAPVFCSAPCADIGGLLGSFADGTLDNVSSSWLNHTNDNASVCVATDPTITCTLRTS